MAKRVVWSEEASEDLIGILKYWQQRNKSNAFSTKLFRLIEEAIDLAIEYPSLGRKTDHHDVKNIRVRHYLIFFREIDDTLRILAIWDSRQDPDRLHVKIQGNQ